MEIIIVIGLIKISPKFTGKIYNTRQKTAKSTNAIFIVSDDDVWKINSDHYSNFDFLTDKKTLIRVNNIIYLIN